MDDTAKVRATDAAQQFLQQLRTATAPMHKQLEATALSVKLVQKDVSAADYAAYLLHMRGVIAFCEQEIFPIIEKLFTDIAARRKLGWIDADLASLAQHATLPATPAFAAPLPDAGLPFALGYMYVVEGSTLGGRFLLNHIKDTLGYDGQHGARFFAGYGADTGKLWKDFLQVFTSYVTAHHCGEAVISGSQYAFTSIEHHLAAPTS